MLQRQNASRFELDQISVEATIRPKDGDPSAIGPQGPLEGATKRGDGAIAPIEDI
jgi:hypothetical protein